MNIAENGLNSIEQSEINELRKILDKNNLSEEFYEYIENNKWISIPNKNIYFNREIMACYPNFLSSKYPILFYNPLSSKVPTVEKALEIIKNNAEFRKCDIEWDIQTLKESKISFFNKKHPMESNASDHRIRGYGGFVYKDVENKILSHFNDPNQNMTINEGFLIPIFRLGRKENHEAFNTDGTAFNYSPETIILLFVLHDLIPDFENEKLNVEYKRVYDEIHEKYGESFDDSLVYAYEDEKNKGVFILKQLLSVDKLRVNLDKYDKTILTDPNRGHWDLFEIEDISELESTFGKKIYRRDPKKDIKLGGIVGIDFGTKSTVVVYQDDNNKTLPMRISEGSVTSESRDSDYENPTVIEFKDIESFMKDYKEKEGRPFTKWNDVTVSHTAFQNLINGTSDDFYSIISDLKQWAGEKNEKITIRDKKGFEMVFPEYMKISEGDMDPIELYAYYIGSYINNMRNGIYMEYLLSFPVTYEKAVREKILESFKRGIKKSLPVSILKDEEAMERFSVLHGANEPAAYAACALQQYGFEPDDESIYYGVFDFGGGTADFDFGIWKPSEDDRNFDYELTHFGAGGDRYLGGENILKEMAYEMVKENQNILRKENIVFVRPKWCDRFLGDEGIIDNSSEAKLNTGILREKLRPFWEKSSDENILKVNLYAKDGSLKTGVEISIDRENVDSIIESKIDRGIENFFIAMNKAMKDENADKINVFLAGNSCKHPKVMELFEKHMDEFNGEIEIFPALGTEEAYEKMEELGIEIDPEDRTNPTGKTGVAYGIIDSRIGGRIDVKNRDEAKNLNNEINFKYYVGYEGRKKFRVVVGPETEYNQFIYFLDVKPMVDLFYTTLPKAMENKMPIAKAKRKRLSFKDECAGGKIYIKSVSPNSIEYVVTKKDIEEKEYLDEKIIELD